MKDDNKDDKEKWDKADWERRFIPCQGVDPNCQVCLSMSLTAEKSPNG